MSSPAMSAMTPPSTPGHSAPDAASRHAKLSAEYAKLRAQFGVVKKAVVEEQGKNADLSDRAREAAVDRRKVEQEMEALHFRNQQLTKRIEVLQEEMEKKEGKHGKEGKSGRKISVGKDADAVQNSESLNSVIGQELSAKIEENERLHERLSTVDATYGDVIERLNSRIRELEAEARRKSQEERADDSKQKDLISGLKTENVGLIRRVGELERELIDHQDRITVLQVQLESKGSLTPSSGGISPTKSGDSGSNFLPLTTKEARVQSVQLLGQFGEVITDLVAGLSDFHTYWEHRLKDTGDSGDNSRHLATLLVLNVKYLKPIEEAFQDLLSIVLSGEKGRGPLSDHVMPLADTFQSYVAYAGSMETLTIACLQDENDNYSCTESQQEKNGQVMASLAAMNESMLKVSRSVTAFSSKLGADDNCDDDDGSLACVISDAAELKRHARQLSNCYSEKALDENHLPTVTEQLRNTNQCIVAALTCVSSAVDALDRLLCENGSRITTLVKVARAGGICSNSPEEQQRSPTSDPKNLSAEAEPEPDSEKEMMVEELQQAKEEKAEIVKVLDELNDKVKKVEQTKEHWKLEYQLLHMKYDKLRSENGVDLSGHSGNDEELLKRPFADRIEEMVSERLHADSRASTFRLECVSLQRRIRSAEKRKNRCEDELKSAREKIELLREDVATTTNSYDGQLSLMTEHLALMNEKVSSKTDEINSLRSQVSNKKNQRKK